MAVLHGQVELPPPVHLAARLRDVAGRVNEEQQQRLQPRVQRLRAPPPHLTAARRRFAWPSACAASTRDSCSAQIITDQLGHV